MKIILSLIFLFYFTFLYAMPPEIQYNQTILENTTRAACKAAEKGSAPPGEVTAYSTLGEYNGSTGPGVRSCSDCDLDSSSNCVCARCYYYYN